MRARFLPWAVYVKPVGVVPARRVNGLLACAIVAGLKAMTGIEERTRR
jgi:hypothetical protein